MGALCSFPSKPLPYEPPLSSGRLEATASSSFLGPLHAPATVQAVLALTERVEVPVQDDKGGVAPAILHFRQHEAVRSDGAVVLVSGVGGGVSGPGGIYPSLGDKLAILLGLPTLRLDFRQPGWNKYCTADLLASLDYLHGRFSSSRFVVVGWSFGGAPCFTAADRDVRIVGVATVASQTSDTFGITRLAPRPVLLIHGTGDNVLSHMCAKTLYDMYGDDLGEKTLKLFDGDDHGLTWNANEDEHMCETRKRPRSEIGT